MKKIKQNHYKKVEDAIISELANISLEWNRGAPLKGSLLTEETKTWTRAIFLALERVRAKVDFSSFSTGVAARMC
jgi:hypothetical protein